MADRFYVTTPIYYVNDVPHIGHAYTTIAADILARRNRLLGKEVFFLTGTDEHGQKVEKAASEKGRTPKEHADLLVDNFRLLWEKLNITNDAFIRTTDEAHRKTVQGLLQRLWDKGEIEKRSYSGWYCTPDERFWTEKDLVEGSCPDCGRPVEQIQEENYFFLMSKYQQRLIDHIEKSQAEGAPYILPETRQNEVLGFLRHNELADLCISRPLHRLSWGIPLPFDDRFVTYVWFDALVNYFSATRYLAPCSVQSREGDFWWPAQHHLVGKDILTTHAVYWSAMLMALELPLPGNIFAHGWWTVEGKKMSKSVGNVVDPHAMAAKYGVDAFRYFLFREVPFGLDGDFSEDALVSRINTDLANDLGNLLSRFLTMAEKYLAGRIDPESGLATPDAFSRECGDALLPVDSSGPGSLWPRLQFNLILDHVWQLVRAANNHIAQTEPWKLAKSDPAALKRVMFNVWNSLRLAAVHLAPFMPETCERIWKLLGLSALADEAAASREQGLALPRIFAWDWNPGYLITVQKGEHLFPRIEMSEKEKPAPDAGGNQTKGETVVNTAEDNLITIQDFGKVQLKIGRVVSAERVKKSDKLLRLEVDTGEMRQVVAGIGKAYAPEDLVNRKIVVVTNLQPAKLMGVESQGMILAATGADGVPVVLMPEKDVEAGAKIR